MTAFLLLSVALAADPVVLDDGRAVRAVLEVQPFLLDQPYRYDWSAEHPRVDRGLLLVLDVDPAWLIPSDTHQAVLYAGSVPVERVNTGWPSGKLAVIVPGEVDLSKTPLYFGGYELPEAVTAKEGAAKADLAGQRGLGTLTAPTPLPALRLADQHALYAAARAKVPR